MTYLGEILIQLSIPVSILGAVGVFIVCVLIIVFVRLTQVEKPLQGENQDVGKHTSTVPELAEGVRTYARNRKAEKPEVKLAFCRNSLQDVLGDESAKLDDVMMYLVKSGYAMKVKGYPECWFID